MTKSYVPATVQPRRPAPVLICKKCLKRAANGHAIKRELKLELKALSHARGARVPRIVKTSCFGLCPKRAVTVASGETLARGEFLLLADADQAAEAASKLTARET